MFIVVDLPAPLGPSRPKTSPAATEKLTSSTATRWPNVLRSCETSRRFINGVSRAARTDDACGFGLVLRPKPRFIGDVCRGPVSHGRNAIGVQDNQSEPVPSREAAHRYVIDISGSSHQQCVGRN